MDNRDEKYMRAALREAQIAFERDEVPIGAVVVAADSIIGRGHNLVETLRDATAHAEMQAITAASANIGGKYLIDCTLYVTVEPCVMCAGAIAWSQVRRVVFGASDLKKGFRHYSKDIIHSKVEVVEGVLQSECEGIMHDFFTKLRN